MAYAQEGLYFSISTPLGKDKLLLRRFHGEERISELFHFHLEMQSEDASLDFSKIVGKSVTITVELADDSKRYVNGIVGRFVQAGIAEGFVQGTIPALGRNQAIGFEYRLIDVLRSVLALDPGGCIDADRPKMGPTLLSPGTPGSPWHATHPYPDEYRLAPRSGFPIKSRRWRIG